MANALTIAMVAFAANAGAQEEPKELNVYNWSDYIGENTVANFEAETGIKIRYDVYDGNETLEAKLMTGNTGYDVVFPSSSFFARQIQVGIYGKLDKAKLPNLANMDGFIMDQVSRQADPGNAHAVPYMWGTNGITYNVKMIAERLPDAPTDSLAMVFDPAVVSKFADCGVSLLDSPEDVIQLALAYMARDPTSQNPDDIVAAIDMVMKVRPFVRLFDAGAYLSSLPNKDICMAMTWSGDYAVAAGRAAEAGVDIELAYIIPKEGTNIWYDAMLIPSDAPHPNNAHLFLDYMMRPEVIAEATNYIWYANANAKANEFVDPEILADPAVYPTAEVLARGYPGVVRAPDIQRIITEQWTRLKAGS